MANHFAKTIAGRNAEIADLNKRLQDQWLRHELEKLAPSMLATMVSMACMGDAVMMEKLRFVSRSLPPTIAYLWVESLDAAARVTPSPKT